MGLKIISIVIENRNTIKVFNKELDGSNMHIAGETGTGKTTAVSSLWDIMERRASQRDYDGITHGSDKTKLKIKLSDGSKTIVAQKVIKKNKIEVVIQDADLNTISREDFEKMISDLSINPHKIMNMGPSERVKMLLSAAELEVDLDEIDKEISEKEEERKLKDREVRNNVPGDEPKKEEPVSVSSLLKDLSINEKIDDIISLMNNAINRSSELEELRSGVAGNSGFIKSMREHIYSIISNVGELRIGNTEEIKKKIDEAEETNKAATKYSNWKQKSDEYEKLKEEHARISEEVKELQKKRKDALENAKWPVDGLSISDGNIYYGDMLLENLGESKQMFVCAAISIGDIIRHPIRVVRMDGVESMSPDDFKALVKLFNGHDIQVLSTRVAYNEIGENEIVIQDGEYGESE